MSVQSVPEIVERVESALRAARPQNGYALRVVADGVRQEDDWWYVPVSPDRSGVRAHEYAELLTEIEDRLREQVDLKVLLIPTFVDDK